MPLDEKMKEIESLAFQIQFSVVGGLRVLQLAMERHPALDGVRASIAGDDRLAAALVERIKHLLNLAETETQLSYDESIAAYLFCLSRERPRLANEASAIILEAGALWWSVQLASHVASGRGDRTNLSARKIHQAAIQRANPHNLAPLPEALCRRSVSTRPT